MRDVVRFTHFVAHEYEGGGFGVQDRIRRPLGVLRIGTAHTHEGEIGRHVDRRQGFVEPDTRRQNRCPRSGKSEIAPTLDRGP